MADAHGFQEHWLNIDPERMERYETMYQWNPSTEAFYTPANRLASTQYSPGCGSRQRWQPGRGPTKFPNAMNQHIMDNQPTHRIR
jgi:hypothetical protein